VAARAGRIEHLHTLSRVWRHSASTRAEIEAFRDRKLRVLVAHAASNVPFYREKLAAAGVRPEEVRSTADLARLPITTKAERRKRPEYFLLADGVDPRRLVSRYTAGSTGEPTRVMRTTFEDHLLNQFRWRARVALGMRVRDRIAYVVSPGVPTDRKSIRDRVRALGAMAGIFRGLPVDCLRSPEEIARDLVRLRPDVISGYASSVVETLEDWHRLGGAAHPPRLVVCGGDVMTPSQRERLRAGFGAPVHETYGCHELNMVAWECRETGDLHLCDDLAIVEVLRDDGRPAEPGESGDVLVTNLHAYAWPYLRYELGDRAVAGDPLCRCGAPFATIRSIQGRTMDALVLPDGRVMHHWELIPMTFWEMPWHRQYQLVQESAERFVLRLVADVEPPQADLEHLHRAVRDKLGPGPTFTIERIDEVERAASGKSRVCVSRMAREDPARGSCARIARAAHKIGTP
jgi:phenylacetate-CoA ligase